MEKYLQKLAFSRGIGIGTIETIREFLKKEGLAIVPVGGEKMTVQQMINKLKSRGYKVGI